MVRKPLRPCNKSGCTNLTNQGYCNNHIHILEERKRKRNRRYDKYNRDKRAASFYKSKEWERARKQRLMIDNGLCLHCLEGREITLADMVDHIVPIRIDWSLRITISNLQSLCNRHHAIKTAEDKRKYGDRL